MTKAISCCPALPTKKLSQMTLIYAPKVAPRLAQQCLHQEKQGESDLIDLSENAGIEEATSGTALDSA